MNALSRISSRVLAIATALTILAAYCPRLEAQTAPVGPALTGPRIGLALSGGGARGVAHIGVLKVLEELRVPISCVTGTSMGAIVGATFAAGRPPAEMEKIVLEADWNEIFRDKPPRDEIAVRRKIDDYKTLFAPEFGVKDGGLALPKGVVVGISIESFFRSMSTPAFGITDFRKLPIPFWAMATDIETGQEVVLDRGSLPQAMRASMSVPGAMAPVEIDGRLLVDGGIANNLPIDQARKLCADVIIAVNISTPPLKRSEITSAVSVVGQLINFLGIESVDKQLKSLGDEDVLIAPDLGDISAAKFDRSKDAIRIGEEATRAVADKLRRYSLPPEQYAALRNTQIAEAKALGTVDEIRVEGLEKTNPAVVLNLVESKPGEPLSEEKIGGDLRRIFGTRDFESISYRIIGGDTGPRAMIIQPTEKAWGADYLRFGVALASDFQGDNAFNALVQYRKTWLNHLGGEWTTEAQIGQNTHVWTEFYQPLNEAGQWFIAPSALIGQQTRRRVRWTGQGSGLSDQRRNGRPRPRRQSGNLGPAASGSRLVEGLRARRHGLARPAFGAGADRGPARGALRRPDQHRLVPVRRLRIHRDGLRRNDLLRVGAKLSACRRDCPRHPQLGAQRDQRLRQRRHGARIRHAGLRVLHARRTTAAVGLPHQRVLRPRLRIRPADVLPQGLFTTGYPWIGPVRGRIGGSRSHDQPIRQLTVTGDALVGVGVPRGGYVPRSRIRGRRLRRSRQLEPLSAARCAVEWYVKQIFQALS